MHDPHPPLAPILRRWPALADLPATPLDGGLINTTYKLGDGHVLQRLHTIFKAEVNLDIAALTAHLHAAGVPVPHICPCSDGQPYAELGPADTDDEALQGVWRILTWLPGATLHRLADGAQAASAASMVARFHRALSGVAHDFHFTRPGAHDTPRHMRSVDAALHADPDHRLADDVRGLRDELHGRWARWDGPTDLPRRIGHGDLKVSNLRFDSSGKASGVLDLDTMAWLELDVELGDALRSWCNRAAEDSRTAVFDVEIFRGAVQGYIGGMSGVLHDTEVSAIVPGLLRICLELTARFAADAVRESYFGWNPAIAPTRGDHNLLRARGQLDLARQVDAHRAELERIVAGAAL